jgi:hypothetical protein
MSQIREFVESDIPQAADLNWRVLRKGKGPSPPALRDFFRKLFFENPWFDKSLPSLVYEGENKQVVGFLGVVPRIMSFRGEPIRAAFGSNLAVYPENRASLAGFHLVKAYLEGKQDLSLTDTANNVTANIQKELGAATLGLETIHWARPLRPTQYALEFLAHRKERRASNTAKFLAKPLSFITDKIGAAIFDDQFRNNSHDLKGEDLDAEELLGNLSQLGSEYSLRPTYDQSTLVWLLNFMDEMKAFGELRRRTLRNNHNKIVGWYIYYLKPGAIGEVVQVGSKRHFGKEVYNHLFQDAWRHGAIGLHGRVEARWLRDLFETGCVFYRGGRWMQAYSRRPELIGLLQSNDTLLTRLDGEWCLSFG